MTNAELDVVESKRGQTPLLLSSNEASEAVALYLLDRGARLDTTDKAGRNILHFACARGWMATLREVINKLDESELLTLFSTADNNGQTPFIAACVNEQRNVVLYLLSEHLQLSTAVK
mmetsp:Transcript_4049/g.8293  ORF Transcript_4049/g.8293 Transcript_4049/m.8293 type:complete len:118 (+) Transcript_4049:345-698(+)